MARIKVKIKDKANPNEPPTLRMIIDDQGNRTFYDSAGNPVEIEDDTDDEETEDAS